MRQIRIIDSHTEGEPTRVVVNDPGLPLAPMTERLAWLRAHDDFRSSVVLEPRGSDVIVGALLLKPSMPDADVAVIFFNNEGYLGMCGHGTIGLVRTLEFLERMNGDEVRVETPAGIVRAQRLGDGKVAVANVPAYRYRADVPVRLEGFGTVRGDIAYGGNWFFLCEDHGMELTLENEPMLTQVSSYILERLAEEGITGADGAAIDHVEFFGPATRSDADSKNFVLCPGLQYDRSPCGTGTSAKLACLADRGKLAAGEIWRQESIIGSLFEGSYEPGEGDKILPTIVGRAYITADVNLIFEEGDPFAAGIRAVA